MAKQQQQGEFETGQAREQAISIMSITKPDQEQLHSEGTICD
jgi:hypothetical protein